MKKLLLFILLLVLAVPAFADTSGALGCTGAPLACSLLSKIFGHISPLPGNTGVLNFVMQTINTGLCVMISIYCGYAGLSVTHEVLKGGLQNVGTQLTMPFARLALAMTLLIPLPDTGYSSYQTVVMNVAVAGADLANKVWSSVLLSIKSGLSITPEVITKSSNLALPKYFYNPNSSGSGYGSPYNPTPAGSSVTQVFGTKTANGGPATGPVKNSGYAEAIFQHALCYETEKKTYENDPKHLDAFPAVMLDQENNMLKFPTTSGSDSQCLLQGETAIKTTSAVAGYNVEFLTLPSAYAEGGAAKTTTNDLIKTASNSMALNIYQNADVAAQQLIQIESKYKTNLNSDFYSVNTSTPNTSTVVPTCDPSKSSTLCKSDAQTAGTIYGTALATSETVYANTMQNIIYPAGRTSGSHTSGSVLTAAQKAEYAASVAGEQVGQAASAALDFLPGGAALGGVASGIIGGVQADEAAKMQSSLAITALNGITPKTDSQDTDIGGAEVPAATTAEIHTEIMANQSASFITAGSYFFELANVGAGGTSGSYTYKPSSRQVAFQNTPTVSQAPSPPTSPWQKAYGSFVSTILGANASNSPTPSSDKTYLYGSYLTYPGDSCSDGGKIISSAPDNPFIDSASQAGGLVMCTHSLTIQTPGAGASNVAGAVTGSANTGLSIASAALNVVPGVGVITSYLVDFSKNMGNPWDYLQTLGKDMLAFSLSILILPPIVVGLLDVISGAGAIDYFADARAADDGIYDALRPLFLLIAIVALVSGIMMVFVFPLVPYMMYLLAMVNWFMLVIEAMVAAPLVAVLIAHPEGHHFWGKSDVAWTLLLNLFIYPTLLVTGMVLCIALVYVSLYILNMTFSSAVINGLSNLNGYSSSGGGVKDISFNKNLALGPAMQAMAGVGIEAGGFMSAVPVAGQIAAAIVVGVSLLLGIPIITMLYTMMVMVIVKQCANLIHILPSKVSRWIGVQGEQSSVAQSVEGGQNEMKQGLKGTIGDRFLHSGQQRKTQERRKKQQAKQGSQGGTAAKRGKSGDTTTG